MNAGSICGQAKGLGFSRDLDPVLSDSGGNNGGHPLQFPPHQLFGGLVYFA